LNSPEKSFYDVVEEWWESHPRFALWTKRIAKVTIVLGIAFLVLSYSMLEYSRKPEFCVTCHYMQPYYDAWKTSSHNNVPCIECHYAPGVKEELRSKWEALSQVAKYVTGTYGTKPWAEISDRSCLRSGCHDKRLLRGQVVFKNILFDHTEHLTELRRGKRLRCVSCHSQIVQGEHMTVTTSTCILCHFKEEEERSPMSDCNLCHGAPTQVVEYLGVRFDHKDAQRFGIDCRRCHERVTRGEGQVPQSRCYTCHAEPERIEKYSDTVLIHDIHITEHKVECTNCHLEIQHQVIKMTEAIEVDCQSCHPDHHATQKKLYMGIGGKGVEPSPDPMFLTSVTCKGCHIAHQGNEIEGFTRTAPPAACMSCHGTKYSIMLDEWKSQMTEILSTMMQVLERAKREVHVAGQRGKNVRGIQEVLAGAGFNIEMVRYGKGVHNIDYSMDLLRTAYARIDSVLRVVGSSYRPPNIFPKETIAESRCLRCHFGAQTKTVRFAKRSFPHREHVVKSSLPCGRCHEDRPEDDERHGELAIASQDCLRCHHQKPENCSSCHQTQQSVYSGSTSLAAETTPDIMFEAEVECESCHLTDEGQIARPTGAACENCHDEEYAGILADWQSSTQEALAALKSALQRLPRSGSNGELKAAVEAARRVIKLVEKDGSRGAHNYALIESLIAEAQEKLEAMKSE
jgi:hypothetical protein